MEMVGDAYFNPKGLGTRVVMPPWQAVLPRRCTTLPSVRPSVGWSAGQGGGSAAPRPTSEPARTSLVRRWTENYRKKGAPPLSGVIHSAGKLGLRVSE